MKTLTPQELKHCLETEKDLVLLDVREPDEFAQGHIPGAINVPLSTINAEQVNRLIAEDDTHVVTYCHAGRRSLTAQDFLVHLGFTNVDDGGGITAWPYEIVK